MRSETAPVAPPGAGAGYGASVTDWRRLALIAISLLTLWRVVMLWFSRTELWIDESQYWLWGQSLSFGAYSKPPLIGWLIRAGTEIAGSGEFGVRWLAPVIHGGTAILVMTLGERLGSRLGSPPGAGPDKELDDGPGGQTCGQQAGRFAGALAGLSFATMPVITLGSVMMTTDTPMMFFIAAALLMQHRLAAAPSAGGAVLLGLAVGFGFLSKHAILYALAGMALAALASPRWRISRRDLLLAALTGLAVAAPNLWWIWQNGFVTLRHLAEDGGATGLGLRPGGALEFVATQAVVMGPILFAAFLLAFRTSGADIRGVLIIAATILAIVTLQALVSRAKGNWAVGFTVAGSIAAASWLMARPRLAAGSLALGLAVALFLPIMTVTGTGWRPGGAEGKLALARFLGWSSVSHSAMDFAARHGAGIVAAHERGLLADLSWQSHGTGLIVAGAPHPGPARHHWDLALPLDAPPETPVVLLLRADAPPACATGPREEYTAGPGFAEGERITLVLTTAACLTEAAND